MKFRTTMSLVCFAVIGFAVPALAVIPIKGNSSHGIGNGSNSWNVTGNFLGVSTTSLAYNTLFPDGQQASEVYDLGNGVSEQVDCTSNQSCNVGDTTPVDFIFQIPVSQIKDGMVTFTSYQGPVSALEVESCSGPSQFGGNQGPGFLCSTYPSGPGNLSVTDCLNGQTLTFTLSGSLNSLGSITFVMQNHNTAHVLQKPALAPQPIACPAVMASFVVADAPLANTPCLNCVNGSTTGTL